MVLKADEWSLFFYSLNRWQNVRDVIVAPDESFKLTPEENFEKTVRLVDIVAGKQVYQV